MNKIAIVIPYFGAFKPSVNLFLKSCNRNEKIDWYIFTDCQIPQKITLNENVKWVLTSLDHIKKLAEKNLNIEVKLNKPYKLCDLKPFYGLIFEDYLNEYEYWGFGDVDVIYGRLKEYLDKINYKKYDKINWMGHLCLVKNNKLCKNVVFFDTDSTISAKRVLANELNLGFDERDYNLKCLNSGMKIYNEKWAADMDIFYWRMRCVDLKTYHLLLNTHEIKYSPKNYSKQIFALLNGKIFRIFLKRKKVHFEEFAYIHFRKEVPINFNDYSNDSFIITRNGFETFDSNRVNDYNYVLNLILKHNNQENFLQELHCFLVHYIRKITNKRKW